MAAAITPAGQAGPAAPDLLWSTGDYDRLASYGSAAEAARLLRFAGVRRGDRVLDVGTGSGIVAIAAAQRGARATGVDPTPALLEKARENAAIANEDGIEWQHGAAERLPFPDASFDAVVSQFAHMFATDPAAAAAEMLRVLKPGGCLAFAAWVPHGLAPQLMGLSFRYVPSPAPPAASPFRWGDPQGVRDYLGDRVRDVQFEHAALLLPALSAGHARRLFEETFGPTVLLTHALRADPLRLNEWRRDHDDIAKRYFMDGRVRFEYLLTRAIKA